MVLSESKLFDGHGPYRVGPNGLPIFSDVVWNMLECYGESAEEFGKRLGRLTRTNNKPYTKSRIYQMLRDNTFPIDNERRWIIAKLLHIPPLLLGVNTLDELKPRINVHPAPTLPPATVIQTTCHRTVDITVYQEDLKRYWEQNYTNTLHPSVGKLKTTINNLEMDALYVYISPKRKALAIPLLCGYHMLYANVAWDNGDAETAMSNLNKGYMLAKGSNLYELQVALLCRRGWVLKECGEEFAGLHDFDAAKNYFTLATKDFTIAQSTIEERRLSPGLNGSILMSLGQLQANVAETPWDLHKAMKKIEEMEPYIGQKSDKEDIHFVGINEERYHLDRAAAYLASPAQAACYPKQARRELRAAIVAQVTPPPKRRLAYNLILQGKSYTTDGDNWTVRHRAGDADDSYAQAAKKANDAMTIVKTIHSHLNIGRLAALYDRLKTTEYSKKSIDVAELELALILSGGINIF